ncbi:MAG: thioredoxin fold domain-containing protein [Candidatus Sericytochromatia bacterium]
MLNKNIRKFSLISFSVFSLILSACNNNSDTNNQNADTQNNNSQNVSKQFDMKSSHSEMKIEKVKWYSYTEGIKKAKAEKKPILVDFYTDWCGYCKKMDAETYSHEKVYNYLNTKFIPIKVNAESQKKVKFDGKELTEQELAMGFQVTSYPTLYFMASEKETIGTAPGFMEANQFYTISSYVGSNAYKKMSLEKYKTTQKT